MEINLYELILLAGGICFLLSCFRGKKSRKLREFYVFITENAGEENEAKHIVELQTNAEKVTPELLKSVIDKDTGMKNVVVGQVKEIKVS